MGAIQVTARTGLLDWSIEDDEKIEEEQKTRSDRIKRWDRAGSKDGISVSLRSRLSASRAFEQRDVGRCVLHG